MEQIRDFKEACPSAGTKSVTMTSVVPARTWRFHAMALAPSERNKIQSQVVKAADNLRTASLALFQEMKDMEVEHVLATNNVVSWAKSCWNTTVEKEWKQS